MRENKGERERKSKKERQIEQRGESVKERVKE